MGISSHSVKTLDSYSIVYSGVVVACDIYRVLCSCFGCDCFLDFELGFPLSDLVLCNYSLNKLLWSHYKDISSLNPELVTLCEP